MAKDKYFVISGKKEGTRIESRVLEEKIQDAVEKGHRHLEIRAFGQHGIGGRLWKADKQKVHIKIIGPPGQRTGSMGFPNTLIDVHGPASDDVGWLNAGATIAVHGNAANGTANAMAQGKIYIAGNIGARGMTMTKENPRFAPPELWVLGSVGDYFGEFMAGGIAVICGHRAQSPDNILGHRPFVGMVGGKILFRGPHRGCSQKDAKIVPVSDEIWDWFPDNLKAYLEAVGLPELFRKLSLREEWQMLTARSPQEKLSGQSISMASFHREVWDRELGAGGLIGDLSSMDMSPVGLLTTGELRRFVPIWENRKYAAPCEVGCPTGIPVHERWRMIREGRVDEAVDLALAYTPFPATICGYLCPNLCMQSCTRQLTDMPAVDITRLGKASISAGIPKLPPASGKRIAVVGGGPAGLSVAWQLRLNGHEAVIYDTGTKLGGKISSVIPDTRVPREIVETELERVEKVIPHVRLQQRLECEDLERMKADFDFVVIAAGAQKPIMLPIPGKERMITASDFLFRAKSDAVQPGKKMVIIGAGNVGCDVATEAHRLGARDIILIDVQKPASFGREREHAEAAGAKFRWPVFTREVVDEGVKLDTGEIIPADMVIISVGDVPDTDFLPESVETGRGFVKVNEFYQTTDQQIFAIGDVVRPGLLTDAVGAGRKAAGAITDIFRKGRPSEKARGMIDQNRVTLEYFDPRIRDFHDLDHCGSQCSSCGACRDCSVCVTVCPKNAISRKDSGNGDYEYVADENRCIGCGFCAQACPCGVWNLTENAPMEG